MDKSLIRVLLAEENQGHTLLMKRELARAGGFVIDVAEDRIACLENLAQANYDVLLLDYNLPKADGLEVLKRVRKRGHNTPVIMIIGQGSESVAAQAMKEGLHDYVVKSGDYLITLPLVIRKAVEKHLLLAEHEKTEKEIKQRNRELTLLNRVITATTSTLDLQRVLQVIADEMAATFGVEQCAIALLDESRQQATVIAEYLGPGRPSALGDMRMPGLSGERIYGEIKESDLPR